MPDDLPLMVRAETPAPELSPEATPETGGLLSVIARAAADPAVDVAKMEALLRLQREVIADQAKAEFNAAYTRLTGRMPRVKKNGRVELGIGKGSYPFAKWEDIDLIIRPLLADEGFGLTFNSRVREGGGLVVVGTLLHRDGFSISAEMPLPLDSGPGRNNLQATGSTLSYGKRYVAEMLLNIVREGNDDDGARGSGEPISLEQLENLTGLLEPAGVTPEMFCQRWKIDALADLPQANFVEAMNGLSARRRRLRELRG